MTEYDAPIPLFQGDVNGDLPVFEMWLGKATDEVHIQINGFMTISLEKKDFFRLVDSGVIAKTKLEELEKKD